MSFALNALVGLAFGLLAAAIAFLITFSEYRKHRLARWRVWREAFIAAAFSFVALIVLWGIALFFLSQSLR